MLIDTHAHYNLPPLIAGWRQHWQKAQQEGVTQTVVVGANLETSQIAVEIASQDKNLFASVGVHPDDIATLDAAALKNLEKLADGPKVIAIGEIGLDYFRLNPNDPQTAQIKEKQKTGFIKQLELTNQLNLPIIIHVRDAYDDALKIIAAHPPKKHFVLHCFSGTTPYVQAMIKLGAFFGVDGNITYKNAANLRDLLTLIPKNKILLETDCPYLPPLPHRGKLCEPWMINLTADYLLKNFAISQKQLLINSQTIFQSLAPYQPGF